MHNKIHYSFCKITIDNSELTWYNGLVNQLVTHTKERTKTMNKNMSISSVKEFGERLQQIYKDKNLGHSREVLVDRVTQYLADFVIENAAALIGLSTDYLAEITGYSKEEIKEISRFADNLIDVCARDIVDIGNDESFKQYFNKIFAALFMIRTKFSVSLWPGVALYLLIEQCAI